MSTQLMEDTELDAPVAYDAFMSYAHANDQRTAEDIRRVLQSIDKSLWKLRSSLVFLDSASLEADSLWDAVAHAIESSKYLVVLASPEAAQSKWVNREINHFIEHNGTADNVLLAMTRGDLRWDEAVNDFDPASRSLPPALQGAYDSEPLFVDLRWVRSRPRGRTERKRFRYSVATLAARIQGRKKHELIGADLSQRRRNRAIAATAVAGLITLGFVAQSASSDASERALRERAQQVAAIAGAELPNRLDRALLLGVASTDIADVDIGRGLFNVLAQTNGVERYAYPSTAARSATALPAGGFITGSVEGEITIWDENLRPTRGPVSVPGGAIRAIAVADPGDRAYLASDEGLVHEISLDSGEITRSLAVGSSARALVILSSSNELLVGGDGPTAITVVDLVEFTATGLFPLTFHRVDALALTASNDYLVVAGRADQRRTQAPVVVIDLRTEQPIAWAQDPFQRSIEDTGCQTACLHSIPTVEAHPLDDGLIFLGTNGGTVAAWRFLESEPVAVGSHEAQVASVRLSIDGETLMSTGFANEVIYWDHNIGRQIGKARTHHGGTVWEIIMLADGSTVTMSDDGTIAQTSSATPISAIGTTVMRAEDGQTIGGVEVLANGDIAMAVGREILVTDPDGTREPLRFGPLPDDIWALEYEGTTNRLFVGLRNGPVVRWNPETGDLLYAATSMRPTDVAAHPDGSIIALIGYEIGTETPFVEFLSTQDMQPTGTTITGLEQTPTSIGFSASGDRLFVSSFEVDDAIFTWPELEQIPLDSGVDNEGHSYAVANSGRFAIGTTGQEVHLFGSDDSWIQSFEGHGSGVLAVDFQPRGPFLASGGDDLVRLWELGERQSLFGAPLVGHTLPIEHLAFSADGTRLYTSSRAEIIMWDLNQSAWRDRACEIVGRSLSDTEWADKIGNDVPKPTTCSDQT